MHRLARATFRFPGALASEARQVSVVGSFNNWDPTVHPLIKTPQGDWMIRLYLTPGNFVYAFCVDGTTWLDPNNSDRVPNGRGSAWSVRRL